MAEIVTDEPEQDPFLIDGLLHSKITLLWGKAKAGKSVFVRAVIAALIRGDTDFLDRAVLQPIDRVLILTSDSGGEREYADALRLQLDEDVQLQSRVLVQTWHENPWLDLGTSEISHALASARIGLVVLDNLQMAMRPGESVNDDAAVRHYTALLARITRCGVACLLVHHSSEKPSVNGAEASTPMGASVLISSARAHVHIRGPGGIRQHSDARVVSNDSERSTINYETDWSDGRPRLRPAQPQQRPPRERQGCKHETRARHLLTAPLPDRADVSKLGRWWTEHASRDGHRPVNPAAGRTAVRKLVALHLLDDSSKPGEVVAGPNLSNA